MMKHEGIVGRIPRWTNESPFILLLFRNLHDFLNPYTGCFKCQDVQFIFREPWNLIIINKLVRLHIVVNLFSRRRKLKMPDVYKRNEKVDMLLIYVECRKMQLPKGIPAPGLIRVKKLINVYCWLEELIINVLFNLTFQLN